MDKYAKDFLKELSLEGSFNLIQEKWMPPMFGWWKTNWDATVVDNFAALMLVVSDDDGLLVYATTKMARVSFVF